jgi:hypothetical protein
MDTERREAADGLFGDLSADHLAAFVTVFDQVLAGISQ